MFHISSMSVRKSTTSSRLTIRMMVAARFMSMRSMRMMSWMPGRCTLMTTSSPEASRARCACAMLADPSGVLSISRNTLFQSLLYSCSTTERMTEKGRGFAPVWSFISSSQYSVGKKSGRILMICPNFTKVGPRSSKIARSFEGVSPCTISWRRRTVTISRRRRAAFLFSAPGKNPVNMIATSCAAFLKLSLRPRLCISLRAAV